jgi:GTP cyclohydrolase I
MLATAARHILVELGMDPESPEVVDTPTRFAKAMRELTRGMEESPEAILSTVFPEEQDEMVVLVGVPFYSLCEHHMLPFFGTATVGYLPGKEKGVVGLSKLARLVECFAHRLQLQERLTRQISESLMKSLGADGAGCVVKARHLCMEMRGVRTTGSEFTTSSLLGSFRKDHSARTEFLALAHA